MPIFIPLSMLRNVFIFFDRRELFQTSMACHYFAKIIQHNFSTVPYFLLQGIRYSTFDSIWAIKDDDQNFTLVPKSFYSQMASQTFLRSKSTDLIYYPTSSNSIEPNLLTLVPSIQHIWIGGRLAINCPQFQDMNEQLADSFMLCTDLTLHCPGALRFLTKLLDSGHFNKITIRDTNNIEDVYDDELIAVKGITEFLFGSVHHQKQEKRVIKIISSTSLPLYQRVSPNRRKCRKIKKAITEKFLTTNEPCMLDFTWADETSDATDAEVGTRVVNGRTNQILHCSRTDAFFELYTA